MDDVSKQSRFNIFSEIKQFKAQISAIQQAVVELEDKRDAAKQDLVFAVEFLSSRAGELELQTQMMKKWVENI
jgi:hypothetical protein